jgi:hypothetical protein
MPGNDGIYSRAALSTDSVSADSVSTDSVSADSVSAVYRGPKKIGILKK